MGKKHDDSLGDIDYDKFHKRLTRTVFIVHEIMQDKESFKETFNELYDYMKQGFEKPEVRKHPLKFRFTNNDSEHIKIMEIRHFIINMIMWRPFMKFGVVEELNSGHIFDATNPTTDVLYDYINEHIIDGYVERCGSVAVNKAITDLIYRLGGIYYDFALIMGLTMDMRMFIDLREKYPRFRELLETKPAPGMQPKEIEDMIDSRLKEYVDLVIQDKDNYLRPFLVSGVGINKNQLAQLSIMGGLKPDIEGNVNPEPIDSNFIYGGLNSIQNFYIDGQAGCKPVILNKTVMGRSGYFSYKAMTLSSNFKLSQTTTDCHSKRAVKFEVKTKKHLQKIDKRYYVGEDGKLKVVNAKTDKHLIGTTILMRDPTTCCAKDGICHVCYGDLYYTNKDRHFNAGRFAATQIANPIGQGILSSKHMLKTVSDLIEYNEDFNRFFKLDANKIKVNNDSEENFSHWRIRINKDDVIICDEFQDKDIDFNYTAEKFSLYNIKTDESIEFIEKQKREIYLYADFANLMNKSKLVNDQYDIPMDKLSDDEHIGAILITNNELTTPLKNIVHLLDKNDHFGCETIDDMVNKIVDLFIESKMKVDAVHGSMIMAGLVRDTKNILLRPDFTKPENAENYQLLRLSEAIHCCNSLTVSLSFDNISKQLTNPLTYKKYGKSEYDVYYKEDIYKDSLKYKAENKRYSEQDRIDYRKFKK